MFILTEPIKYPTYLFSYLSITNIRSLPSQCKTENNL